MSTAYQVPTYQDAYEHLLDVFGITSRGQLDNRVRSAILQAFNDFTNDRQWNRYQTLGRITTDAQYTTGTIAYDHTGGAHERQLTLTDGVWPTWTEQGEVVIALVRYPVDQRISDTVATLGEALNPGADVAADTSYALQRDLYPLPDDFFQMARLVDVRSRLILARENPDQINLRKRISRTTGNPQAFSLQSYPKYLGGLGVQIAPIPTDTRVLDFVYWRSPRPLRLPLYDEGTITVSAGSTSVTGTGTAWATTANGVRAGAVLRIGADGNNRPTGLAGYASGYFPFVEQAIIRSVTNGTTLVLEQPVTYAATDVKYSISDPIDMDQNTTLNYFLRLCEAKYAQLASRADAPQRLAIAERAMLEAADKDNRNTPDMAYEGPYGLAGIAGTVETSP